MAETLNTLFAGLQGTGFYTIVLPFLLVFALVYGLLEELDQLPKQANAIVALALAFYAAFSGVLPTLLFETAIAGQFGLLLVFVLMLMIGAQLTGLGENFDHWSTLIGVIAVGGIAILIWVQGGIEGVYGAEPFVDLGLPVDLPTLLILVAALVLIGWMVYMGDNSED